MPETMSVERRRMMKAYGAELVLTEGAKGMKAQLPKRMNWQIRYRRLSSGTVHQSQNPAAHKSTTGPEIWADTDGRVDIFVSGVGTGER